MTTAWIKPLTSPSSILSKNTCKILERIKAKSAIRFANSRLELVILAYVVFFGAYCAAHAATDPNAVPPDFSPLSLATDPNGVDLLSGTMKMPMPVLSIPADPHLQYQNAQKSQLMVKGVLQSPPGSASGGDAATSTLHMDTGDGTSEAFTCRLGECLAFSSPVSFALDGSGSIATNPMNVRFRYVQAETGKTIIYDTLCIAQYQPPVSNAVGPTYVFSYYASSVEFSDGEILYYTYDTYQVPGYINYFLRRPAGITSNHGYYLKITYQSNDGTNVGWGEPSSAAIFQNGNTVPLRSETFPDVNTVIDADGRVWKGSFGNELGESPYTFSGYFQPPAESSPTIAVSSEASDFSGSLITNVVKGGQSWTYSYNNYAGTCVVPGTSIVQGNRYSSHDVSVTGPAAYFMRYSFYDISSPCTSGPELRLASATDALGRTTSYGYTWVAPAPASVPTLSTITYPEGSSVSETFDLVGNVTQRQLVPKPGSGQPLITETATYPGCDPQVGAVYCFRPTATTDGKGNQTDYLWDQSTGELLAKTSPADPSGVRPQIRFTYAQRYAWWSNGSGGYTRALTPIWVKTSESYCQNSAATGNPSAPCNGNDEVLTTYDYGPDAGPNYLLVRGVAVTAGGVTRRICYTYDALGNRISETKPDASLAVCP